MRLLHSALPFALALVVAGGARAEGIAVAIDHSARLNVRGSAASVVVGNPAIADVNIVDTHTLFISGRSYGSTDLNITDAAGRTLYSGEIAVIRPAAGVTLYRGADRTDFYCTTGCAEAARATPTGAAKPDQSPSVSNSGISTSTKP